MKKFATPESSLGQLDAEIVATLLATASDIALSLDDQGVITDLAFGNEELAAAPYQVQWLGKPWVETVTVESRQKIARLLNEADKADSPKWRQVNHPSGDGSDLPVVYTTLRIGNDGRQVAIGRELRQMAALQQRLLDAQHSIERDYSRLRQMETRYRLLFQQVPDAVLVVDAATQKILEANPAAEELMGGGRRKLSNRKVVDLFGPPNAEELQAFFSRLVMLGDAAETTFAADGSDGYLVSGSLFREDEKNLLLLRIRRADAETDSTGALEARKDLIRLLDAAPDGFVLANREGQILAVNSAFLEMTQLATEDQARGESLDEWLGRSAVDFNVLLGNARERGSVRLFATTLRGLHGARTDVEVSAVAVPEDRQGRIGFIIRDVNQRLVAGDDAPTEIEGSTRHLAELVGKVSLKEIVRETTDVIERMCIESALELTRNNRASAAEMLGLSRQSLYAKLHRYGLGDLSPEN